MYISIYTWSIFPQSIKKIEGPIWYSVTPYPIRKLALRARRVNPALDPGGRGKGLDTVCARLATVRFSSMMRYDSIDSPPVIRMMMMMQWWWWWCTKIRVLQFCWNLYTCSKIVTNIVMGLKLWCQVGEFGFYFQNSYGKMCFWKIILKVRCFKNLMGTGTKCIQAFPDQALTSPSGVQRRIYTPSAKREFDGMGWVGGLVGRGIKSVLQISLYFVGI